jgi:periplasmic protein TonB
MITWATFLTDHVAERMVRIRSAAAGLSALLHAALVLAAFAELSPAPTAASEFGIAVTLERAPQADDAASSVTPAPLASLLSEPAPGDPPPPKEQPESTAVPESVVPESAVSDSDAAPEVPREPPEASAALAPTPSEPTLEQEASAMVPPPPPEPPLEAALPPVEAPPTVDAHDFARATPAPVAKPTPPQAAAKPTPPQAAAVQPPPGTRAAQDAKPGDPAGLAGRTPAAAPKSEPMQRKAEEDYFWQIVRKISQYRFYSKAQDSVLQGLVVTRMTIARDGRLLDVSLLKSSGFPNLDRAVVETIRQASPFAPLPADLAQSQQTFIVPVNYTRER